MDVVDGEEEMCGRENPVGGFMGAHRLLLNV